ncbi:MAG: DUF4142 domain-containing protein [Blastocatellia bacterium]
MKNKFYFPVAILLFATGTVLSQSDTQSSRQATKQDMKTNTMRTSSADHHFVEEAAVGGMAEVAFGQMAVERAANQDVKNFAQRMVDDHSKANQELMQLAETKGIKMSDSSKMGQMNTQNTNQSGMKMTEQQMALKGKEREMMNRMMKLSGAEFDREYMRSQLKDHEKDIALFEKEANSGNDADLKAFAAKTLPTLREHQQMARDIAAKVGVNATKSGRK